MFTRAPWFRGRAVEGELIKMQAASLLSLVQALEEGIPGRLNLPTWSPIHRLPPPHLHWGQHLRYRGSHSTLLIP